ncbi:DUF3793 family protein [Ruminococcus sp.]|uniref:DUF3793 family protein n=1 Tax=Ruminococcus sp. TaxID=41978 RepID=UPI0025EDAF7E|nr:DUF3793 family protein [Ruminococcus sp.]MBQ8965414.1 DUF3793 family protein [Ruminococcus sp.]
MSSTEKFERELALHTAPTMLGIKPANLLTVEGNDKLIRRNIDRFNSKASAKGLHIREIKRLGGRTLMLLYNEKLLNKRLCEEDVCRMFSKFGYAGCSTCPQYLEKLCDRMESSEDFPHEIGLFLGYPVDDIKGFIRNKGQNCLLCGYWKVYCDADGARRTFSRYTKCTRYMVECLDKGKDIYSALRIS